MTATWTNSRTWVAGEVVTAAIMNTYVRDDFDFLKTPATSGRINFAADVNVTSTTMADVTGLTTTFTTYGGGVDVWCPITIAVATAVSCRFQILVDGATSYLLGEMTTPASSVNMFCGFFTHIPALSAGSHTIKVQCRSGSGTIVIRGTTGATADPLLYCREAGA